MNNVFAYTAPGCNYPEYISLNVDEQGNLTVTVRPEPAGDGVCPQTVSIKLTPEQVKILARQLFSFANNTLVQS